jgi:hypothetical protein
VVVQQEPHLFLLWFENQIYLTDSFEIQIDRDLYVLTINHLLLFIFLSVLPLQATGPDGFCL